MASAESADGDGETTDINSIDQQTAEQLLSQIDQLSEQEVDSLLSQMLVAADEQS